MKSPAFSLLFTIALIPIVVFSQSNSPQSPVEIGGEPRHHPKFENEFVRIWDVTVPAGDATLWHVHRNEVWRCQIQQSDLRSSRNEYRHDTLS